jgi:glycosyltransferase involved in cell wall biosynthesis
MPPRISVLIPAFNEEAQLPLTLRSVRESFAEIGETAYEIIVCDNNSTDATTAVAQEHGARVVFEPHNQIARARNTAAERSVGEWLIFLDADTRLNADLLAATLRLLQAGGVCGGGSVVRFDVVKLAPLHAGLMWLWNTISVQLSLAAGSYIFCPRQAWEAVGGFDQTIYAGEEIFFSRKVKRWGRERQLRFIVIAGSPIVTSSRKLEWYGQWKMLGHILRMIRPGAIRKRENCGLWYERPGPKE